MVLDSRKINKWCFEVTSFLIFLLWKYFAQSLQFTLMDSNECLLTLGQFFKKCLKAKLPCVHNMCCILSLHLHGCPCSAENTPGTLNLLASWNYPRNQQPLCRVILEALNWSNSKANISILLILIQETLRHPLGPKSFTLFYSIVLPHFWYVSGKSALW